jgi:hypothetical protein
MNFTKGIGLALTASIMIFGALAVVEDRSTWQLPSLISSAEARVGRPLTPVSVAGVARRTARRCANGTYNC